MARVYTSRQLLDPYFVQMRQQADNAYLQRLQDQRNKLYDSLEKGVSGFGTLAAGAVGLGIDLYKKGKRKDQINQYKDEKAKQRASELDALKTKMANETDPAKLQELTNQYNNLQNMPLFDMSEIGAMNDYVENADSSKFLTLRQIKEANEARKQQLEESKLEREKNEAFHKSVRLAQARPEYAATQKQMFDAIDAGDFETANIYASKLKAYETEFGTEPFGGAAETAKINRMKTAEAKKLAEKEAKAAQEAADKAEAERQYRVADYLTKIPTTFKDEDAKTEWYEYIRNNVDMTPSEKASEINNLRNIETGKTKMKKASQSAAATAVGDETKKGIEDTKNKKSAQAYDGKKMSNLEWDSLDENIRKHLYRDASGIVRLQ